MRIALRCTRELAAGCLVYWICSRRCSAIASHSSLVRSICITAMWGASRPFQTAADLVAMPVCHPRSLLAVAQPSLDLARAGSAIAFRKTETVMLNDRFRNCRADLFRPLQRGFGNGRLLPHWQQEHPLVKLLISNWSRTPR